MEQNNNTGRMGPREGSVAGGGRSWENKPGRERRRWRLIGQKERIRICGKQDAWKTQSFPELNTDFPKFGVG